MDDNYEEEKSVLHYFVDETGGTTLFNRKGWIIIGNDGCRSGSEHIVRTLFIRLNSNSYNFAPARRSAGVDCDCFVNFIPRTDKD